MNNSINYTDYLIPFKATARCFKENLLEKYQVPALNNIHLFLSRLFVVTAVVVLFLGFLPLFMFFGTFLFKFLVEQIPAEVYFLQIFTLNKGIIVLFLFFMLISFFFLELYLSFWYATRLALYLSMNTNLLISSWYASRLKQASTYKQV